MPHRAGFATWLRRSALCPALAAVLCSAAAAPAQGGGISAAWRDVRWGDTTSALLRRLGPRARLLARPLDFGDSYAAVVLPRVMVGPYRFIAYFQMDRATGRLKRIQLERPRHGVNPPAFRAALAALTAEYGPPDASCETPPGPKSGYQAAAVRLWVRNATVVRAIFRDTTIEAVEGCIDRPLGACGLTAQLIIRFSPEPRGAAPRCR